LKLANCGCQVDCSSAGLGNSYCSCFGKIGAGTRPAAKTTERLSPDFGSGKGSTGPLRNHSGFVLSDRSKDMDREPVRLWEIDRLEFDPGVHEVGYKRNVSGQTVELCDNQGGFVNPAGCQGFGELRSVATTAAFDFRELAEGRYAVQVGLDGLPLRLKPEAATALASRADPEISNVLAAILSIHGVLLCVQRSLHRI
jgi:hypothetical protein